MSTLADTVVSATAALNANAQKYFDLEERVALREARLVSASGQAPNSDDVTELLRAAARGWFWGSFSVAPGAGPNNLIAVPPNGLVFPTIEPWTLLRGFCTATNTSPDVKFTALGVVSAPQGLTGKLLRRDGSPLGIGELPVNVPFSVMPDTAGNFLIAEVNGNDQLMKVALSAALYPAVNVAADGTGGLPVVVAGGNAIVFDASNVLLWRGFIGFQLSALPAAQRTFATLPSKTYHGCFYFPGHPMAQRDTWPYGRPMLRDCADTSYIAAGNTEGNRLYDTSFDNVLMFKATTDASGNITILPLLNRQILYASFVKNTFELYTSVAPTTLLTLNWGRAPQFTLISFNGRYSSGYPTQLRTAASRYIAQASCDLIDTSQANGNYYGSGQFNFDLRGYSGT